MQAHRFGNLGTEVPLEKLMASLFMQIVNPCCGRVVFQIVQQVPDIMQQGSYDQALRSMSLCRQAGRLQCVLCLCYRLAAIPGGSSGMKQFGNFLDDAHSRELSIAHCMRADSYSNCGV